MSLQKRMHLLIFTTEVQTIIGKISNISTPLCIIYVVSYIWSAYVINSSKYELQSPTLHCVNML